MKRTASVAEKLLTFEGFQPYLQCESSKLRIYVIGSKNAVLTGKRVPIEIGSKVIVAWLTDNCVGVSASVYKGFGIFDEVYYENLFFDVENRCDMIVAYRELCIVLM